jgi:hypothetical protein
LHIARRKASHFSVNGGAEPRRVGLALEDLFNRHQHLSRQISDRVSDAQTIFTALHDGLLVVDAGAPPDARKPELSAII